MKKCFIPFVLISPDKRYTNLKKNMSDNIKQ